MEDDKPTDSMTPERLLAIRGFATMRKDACALSLLDHIDFLDRELTTAKTAWQWWKKCNDANFELREKAETEVKRLREALKDMITECAVSSTLQRARRKAEEIVEKFKLNA